MRSLPKDFHAVVIGARGGIGAAFADQLAATTDRLHLFSRPGLDLSDEASIADASRRVGAHGPVHLVVVATGLLHDGARGIQPEKSLRDLSAEKFAAAFAVNATGPALVAKHFLPLLARDDKSVFAALSARVGSISDNELGGWYAYRASKAALNMVLKNAAIETARRNKRAVIVGLQPGTVTTGLSEPFRGGTRAEKLFTPSHAAEKLLWVLDRLTADQTGGFFDHSGASIPF